MSLKQFYKTMKDKYSLARMILIRKKRVNVVFSNKKSLSDTLRLFGE